MDILGVSFDSTEDNLAFSEKEGFPFDLICDTDRVVGLAYGACDALDAKYPRRISYLIDREGKVAQAYPDVDPAAHAGQVLEDLWEL